MLNRLGHDAARKAICLVIVPVAAFTLVGSSAHGQVGFEAVDYACRYRPARDNLTAGDFDGDGLLDLAAHDETSFFIKLRRFLLSFPAGSDKRESSRGVRNLESRREQVCAGCSTGAR